MYNFEQVKKTCKTPLGETGCLGNPYFTGCLSIHFLNLHTHVTDLRDTMPRQRSLTPHMWLVGRYATPGVTLHIPREAEDFPRGDKHFKHVPPPTYLICLSPKDLYR